jgi:anti-anti-sigma factor
MAHTNTPATTSAADDVVVLTVTGELDAYSGAVLRERILAEVGPSRGGVVLDLAGVRLASAGGARAVADTAARLAETGRLLLIACCPSVVLGIVRQVGPSLGVVAHPSVAAALATYHAKRTQRRGSPKAGLNLLRQRARGLPSALRSRPLIAGSIDELRKRYDLLDSDAAFTVFRRTSQRYNLKLRVLAPAFLSAPPASPERPTWFTGRRRHPPPPTTFAVPRREWPNNRDEFLSTVLDSALSIMDTEAGYLQLSDRFLGGLRLAVQHGLPREFRQVLDDADQPVDAGIAAFDSGEETTRSIAEEPDPTLRTLLGAAGLRSVHSVPLAVGDQPTGVVTTLHDRRVRRATRNQAAALDVVATESAAWLDWYQRTVVLDALEHLHDAARSAARR